MYERFMVGLALGDSVQGIYVEDVLVHEAGHITAEDLLRVLREHGIIEALVTDLDERCVDLPDLWGYWR